MVMAISGAVMLTGGVFPVGLGLPFEPESPPGITVPEWYLTGLYAFLRTMYDKFVTGVAWPGLFIFVLLIVPFIDKYKKFSWKDRPIVTALGITSLAQIIVTTYWGFYIDPDIDKALLERLVIDPIFFYLVMILLVPMSFGFSYMMIKLAKHAEANAKLHPKKVGKSSINLSQKWIYALFVVLLAFQVYLNIAAYYAMLQGMKNYSLFIVGIISLVFAGMFHLYRYGRTLQKAPPPKPVPPTPSKAAPKPAPAIPAAEKPLAAPPTASTKIGSEQVPQLSQQQKQVAGSGKAAAATDGATSATIDSPERKKSV
jgi:ubiquinol-cytochrome c reductase cytochrome b subunit